jgi:peptidoglycan/LPS O-acetylase OafA/YrhL
MQSITRGSLPAENGDPAGGSGPDPYGHLGYIDGLRALAVFGVVFTHAVIFSPTPWPEFNHLATLGRHGVVLFFVISGFCLSYPYLKRVRDGGAFKFVPAPYFAKRTLRILPPYYAAMFLVMAFYAVTRMGCSACSAPQIVQQLLFLDKDNRFIIPAAWTLPIEFRWYFLFPLVLPVFVRYPRVFMTSIVSLWVIFYASRLRVPDALALPSFMLGILAAGLLLRPSPLKRFALPVFFATLPALVLVEPTSFQMDPIAAIAAFCFVWAVPGTALQRLLSTPPLRFLGVCSYSIYLIHGPVLAWLQLRHGVPFPLSICAAIAVSVGFWYVVERPLTGPPLKPLIVRRLTAFLDAKLFAPGAAQRSP